MRALLRKCLSENADPEAVAEFFSRGTTRELSGEEFVQELCGWLLEMKDSIRRKAFPSDYPVERLVEVFQKVAQSKGVAPQAFYGRLLSGLLKEGGDRDETGQSMTRYSTKERILDAALEMFSEKGFHSATVDEIAERAGVGKGTLYRYFANKETLFNELVRIRLEELERKAWSVFNGHDDVLTMIRKYLHIYFEFFDRNQRLYRLINQERLELGEQVQDLYFRKVMKRAPLLKKKIYEASQQGILKDVDFQTVFYGVMGFIHGVIQKWLARDCSYSLVQELPAVTEVLFYGFVKNANAENKQTVDHR
ncbi:MAG: TetR/AcrR family transcriptional regulator [Deltaproteobacteria bacterium]|nr:TetR/AcrR family transcriptional regulator [Deltaproteobacteria bacterium]